MPDAPGRMLLFFGARRPQDLPYFGPLQKVPDSLLGKHFAYSRVPGGKKVYVQDLIRREETTIVDLLRSSATHIYVCGLKGMEQGVDTALDGICRASEMHWHELRGAMRAEGRYHVETY